MFPNRILLIGLMALGSCSSIYAQVPTGAEMKAASSCAQRSRRHLHCR